MNHSSSSSAIETLKLITRGRKTGLPHIVRLRFVVDNGHIYLLAGRKYSDWFLNALHYRVVRIKIGNILYEADAFEVDKTSAIGKFYDKYGSRLISTFYADCEACLKLNLRKKLVTSAGEADTHTTIDKWILQNKNYYSSVARAFDSASEEYDYTISRNRINTWIRKRSLSLFLSLINKDSLVLDIGCGTGEEALKVARYVRKLIAIDISDSMIGLLRMKVRARRFQNKVIPLTLPASKLESVKSIMGNELADAAYSFNGCLNCEPNLRNFVLSLSELLKPGSYFVCSIRNSVCASEMLSHLFTFQFAKCTPRKKQPAMVSVGGFDIPAYYYTPNRFASFFSPLFKLKSFFALPAIIPPAYLSDHYVKLGHFTNIIERADTLLSSLSPINMLGDQTLFVFERIR